MPEPNDLLRAARRRLVSPSGSGRPLSRQELAEAVNAWLYENLGRMSHVDGDQVGQWERGLHRWPAEHSRRALRAVLGADSDKDLGFYITREPLVARDPAAVARSPEPTRPVDAGGASGSPGDAVGPGFAALLRDLRVRRGLSLRQLAEMAHYSRTYISDLEKAITPPTTAVASALDTALGAGGKLCAAATGHRTATGTETAAGGGQAAPESRAQPSPPLVPPVSGAAATGAPAGDGTALGFAALLKYLRAWRGLSLVQLAKLVHYSKSYIWDLETGKARPTADMASALDTALDAGGKLYAAAAKQGRVFADSWIAAGIGTTEPDTITPPSTVSTTLPAGAAVTLTITASPTGAVRVVIDAGPSNGPAPEAPAATADGARVYSLAREHTARVIRAS